MENEDTKNEPFRKTLHGNMDESKWKKKFYIVLVISVIALIVAAIFIFLYFDKDKNENNENNIQENGSYLNNIEEPIKIIEKEQKPEINENKSEKSYIIDDNLKTVVTVKQQNETLFAIVEKIDENGELIKVIIPTDELRRTNPWILLDFYESKIKFT